MDHAANIRERAYFLWKHYGQPKNRDLYFWRMAEVDYWRCYASQPLSEDLIREAQDQQINWDIISGLQHLSENFIREFQHKVYWVYISIHQLLSENFIREFQHKINWLYISKHQPLSENFIREFQDKVYWDSISAHQQLSGDFIREFENRINKDLIPKKLSREEKIEKLKPYYEIIDNKLIAYKSVRLDGYSFSCFRYFYEVGQTYESWCDCTCSPNSFGMSAWTREKAEEFGRGGVSSGEFKLFKVEVDIDDIGAIVHDCGKLRCFKLKILEEV